MNAMAFELPSDPNFWVAVTVAVGTAVLAFTTGLYMVETRRLRLEAEKTRIASQRPSFAIVPSLFVGENNFHRINLVNHGQTATNITARCDWFTSREAGGSSRTFFVLSLAKDGYAGLDVPVNEIVTKGLQLWLEIKCKDAVGNDYMAEFLYEFNKIKGTSTRIAYQNNYSLTLHDALDRISRAVEGTNRDIDKIASKIK